jgi:hypothetical protein
MHFTHTHTECIPLDFPHRSRPTIFLHFLKGTYTIKVKETTLLVEFFSVDSILILTDVLCLAVLPRLLKKDEHDAGA